MNTKHSVAELWGHLSQRGLVDGEPPSLPASGPSSMPWYVSALVGISGWVAAAFLLLFLSATDLINDDQSMLITGSVFCVVALGLKFGFRDAVFPNQLSFALSLAGQGLVIGSRFEAESMLTVVITVLILEGILFLIYPDSLHRLISLMAMIVAIVVQLFDSGLEEYLRWVVLFLAAATVLVWQGKNTMRLSLLRDFFGPLSFGLPLAALIMCVMPFLGADFGMEPWWIAALGMGLLLIILGALILRDLDLRFDSAAGVGVVLLTALLMIPGYQTPGVIMAALILAIGYWHRQRPLLALGIVGFALYIGFYYYNLELTLLTKSLILMGTGVALLGLRIVASQFFGGGGFMRESELQMGEQE